MPQEPQELRLILTLEHIPAHDVIVSGHVTDWTFGLVMSVAVRHPLALDKRDLLRPWLWRLTDDLLFRIDTGGTSGTVDPARPAHRLPATFGGAPVPDSLRDHASTALNLELGKIPAPPAGSIPDGDPSLGVVWNPETGQRRVNAPVQSGVSTEDGRERRPWHTILGQASRYAAPIPQALRISHLFRIPVLAGAGPDVRVLAAPIIDISPPAFPSKITPLASGPALWIDHGGAYRWPYDLPALDGIPVVAYLMPAVIRASTDPGVYFDLRSLWVSSPSGTQVYDGEDWRAALEQRMADSLDLGARVLEAARPRLTGVTADDRPTVEFPPTPANRLAIERLVLTSLRDLTGIGYRAAPGGTCLINSALSTYASLEERKPLVEPSEAAAADAPIRTLIERKVSENFDTLEIWKKFLRETLSELAGSGVLAEGTSNTSNAGSISDATAFEHSIGELDHLRQAVLRPANLELLVRAQWKRIAQGEARLQRLTKLAERAEFPIIDLRSRLAKENLWTFWQDFIRLIQSTADDPSGRASVVSNFPRLFETYFRLRSGAAIGPAPECTDPALTLDHYTQQFPTLSGVLPGEVVGAVCREILFYSGKTAPQLVSLTTTRASVEPTDVPQAITIQVNSLEPLPSRQDEIGNPDKDLLDQISGIGVLMREAPPSSPRNGKGWLCLNFASPQFRGQSVPEALVTLVPLRMIYQNDLRHSLVTYNNHPISAESPVGDLSVYKIKAPATDALRSPVASVMQGDQIAPVIRYLSPTPTGPSVPGTTRRFLPGLKFGANYEMLPFLMTNSGCLPRELVSGQPYEADVDAFDSESPAVRAVVAGKIRVVPYLRRVRVGEPRVPGEKGGKLNYPSIPEGVALRLRDLDLLRGDASDVERGKEHPALLLRPTPGSWNGSIPEHFSFQLRKPATDINTWDRWVASEETNRQLRKDVWAAYYYQSDQNAGRAAANTTDVSIDDPALREYIYAELLELDGAGRSDAKWGRYLEPVIDPLNALSRVHRRPVNIACVVDEAFGITATAALDALTVHLTEGRVYRLTIWSSIAFGDRPRFDNIIPSVKFNTKTPDGGDVILVSPLTLFIESATRRLLDTDELPASDSNPHQVLYDALAPKFEPGAANDAIRVSLLQTGSNDSKRFRYVHRAELSRQVWRWQGRETALHPRLKLTADERSRDYLDAVEQWEEREFGNRDELDRLVVPMETVVDRPSGRRSFEYKEKLTDAGHVSPGAAGGGSGDLRALHYRFSVRLFSRYAPLFANDQSVESARMEDLVKVRTQWKPLFVPCRRTEPLDTPKLRFILPLTESFGASASESAGVLVVFDEPWYQVGGLGETMTTEVVTVKDPTLATMPDAFEAGPDPIVATAVRELSVSFGDRVLPFEIRGPIGHTFDRSDDAPFFTATSFIVPAPKTIRASKPGDPATRPPIPDDPGASPAYPVPWSFAKLRFRRTIILHPPGDGLPINSPYTKPFWVQFIPEFSLLAQHQPSDLRVRWDGPRRVTIIDAAGRATTLPPQGAMFERYLVLTRRVSDARGDKSQEAYIAVLTREGASASWIPLDPQMSIPQTLASDLRARVMDVQRRHSPVPVDSERLLWARIFSEETRDSDRLRIVGVSGPIESTSAQR